MHMWNNLNGELTVDTVSSWKGREFEAMLNGSAGSKTRNVSTITEAPLLGAKWAQRYRRGQYFYDKTDLDI